MDCKVGDLFFCSGAELNLRCSAEQKPPLKNPRSATAYSAITVQHKNVLQGIEKVAHLRACEILLIDFMAV